MTRGGSRNKSPYEGLITALAIGGFFIILGLAFVLSPGLSQKTNAFFSDLTTVIYPPGTSSSVNLPAPAHPAEHISVYTALMNFFLGVGILQIIILGLRILIRSRIKRIAETVGNLIFWLGASVTASVFLLAGTLNGWFQFWSTLIILAGLSLIARFLVQLVKKNLTD